MNSSAKEIGNSARGSNSSWDEKDTVVSSILSSRNLKLGAVVGLGLNEHAEAILTKTSATKLYGIATYQHIADLDVSTGAPRDILDENSRAIATRFRQYGDRFVMLRLPAHAAAAEVIEPLDFALLDVGLSYDDIWYNLCTWYSKVREGGIIGGYQYEQAAIDRFFRRLDQHVNVEKNGVWWIEKTSLAISFFIPAYNCAATIEQSVDSILHTNLTPPDEIIIVNDGSTDDTERVILSLAKQHSVIRVVSHPRNRGGGAARNTAADHATHPLLFCLDADNILAPSTIPTLKRFLINSGADAAAMASLYYFRTNTQVVTHKWTFAPGKVSLSDCLASNIVPPSSGNYLFTRESWIRAGGYPEFAGALDAWGFGFRQLATGTTMMVMPDSYYYHRYGHESYWVRESADGHLSLKALQVIIPFLHLFDDEDVDYILGVHGRYRWFSEMESHPIRVKMGKAGSGGIKVVTTTTNRVSLARRIGNKLKILIRRATRTLGQ